MRSAIFTAMDIFRTRKRVREINSNPLQISPKEKRRSGSEIE
jgi:hypothetical protein